MAYRVTPTVSDCDGTEGLLERPSHPGLRPRVFIVDDHGDVEQCDAAIFHRDGARARTFFCCVKRPDTFEVVS